MSKEVKYVLISGIGHTIVMIMAVASGAFLSNALFFVSLVLFVLLQWWTCRQEYKRGYENGKKLAGHALSAVDTCFDQFEREMRLRIQKDLKKHGIDMNLIKEEKKYNA